MTLIPQEALAPYAEMLGCELAPDTAHEVIKAAIGSALDAADAARAEAESAVALSRSLEAKVADLTSERDQAIALSRTPATAMLDPEALMDRADMFDAKISVAVAEGDMPPFIATGLRKLVKSDKGPNAIMLSRSGDIGARPVEAFLELFKGAKLGAQKGEQSGPQTAIPLSREVPGKTDEKPDYDPDYAKARAARVSAPKPA